jgi:hypothetical protein
MDQNGRHEHAFFNPAGIAFLVRCFSRAPGVTCRGTPDTTFSWFAGYAWQIASCGRCGIHVGWRFSKDDTSFYALISKRLI